MTGWLGIRIICPSGATCLPADYCFSELALQKSNSVGEGYLRKIPVERKLDCSRNRYFSQITLSNRIYLFNYAEYLTASKTVTCKHRWLKEETRVIRNFSYQFKDFSAFLPSQGYLSLGIPYSVVFA
jgi:hypothetical protein